ncbi:MAG: histidine kinase dimerization/phospho-acceptor domain-containing protein [Parvibaculum sp.]
MFRLKDHWSDWLPASDRASAITIMQLKPLARIYLDSYKFSLLGILIVTLASLIWIDWALVASWTAFVVFAQLLVVHTARNFLGELDTQPPLSLRRVRHWAYRIIGTTSLFNIAGGLSLLMFWREHVPENNYFLLFVAAASITPSILVNYTYLPTALTSIFIITGSAILTLVVHFSNVNLALSIGFVIYAVSLTDHIVRINADFTAKLIMAYEKNHLIDTLYKTMADHAAARKTAEDASRVKSQFLANMSHELRTPLNAILGFAEIMKKQVFGPIENPKYQSYLDDIHSSGLHLLGLINDVLDLSKIEAGQYSLDESEVNIDELAEDCIRLIDIRAVSSDIGLEKHFVQPLPMLKADQRAMRQIWLNLIANAVKFSGKGQPVTLTADYLADGSFYIGVDDQGPGIAPDEIEAVLNTFAQGTEGKARPGEGSGLGLAIVQGLLAAHGGSFKLDSELGKGTSVRAIFPGNRVIHPHSHLRSIASS